jgi:hypothetical protein
MNEKIIKPLNNDIKIEENKSFASKDIQKKRLQMRIMKIRRKKL